MNVGYKDRRLIATKLTYHTNTCSLVNQLTRLLIPIRKDDILNTKFLHSNLNHLSRSGGLGRAPVLVVVAVLAAARDAREQRRPIVQHEYRVDAFVTHCHLKTFNLVFYRMQG